MVKLGWENMVRSMRFLAEPRGSLLPGQWRPRSDPMGQDLLVGSKKQRVTVFEGI